MTTAHKYNYMLILPKVKLLAKYKLKPLWLLLKGKNLYSTNAFKSNFQHTKVTNYLIFFPTVRNRNPFKLNSSISPHPTPQKKK